MLCSIILVLDKTCKHFETIAFVLAQVSQLLFCGGECHWTEHHTGGKVLVDRPPRPKLGVDRPEQDGDDVDKNPFA